MQQRIRTILCAGAAVLLTAGLARADLERRTVEAQADYEIDAAGAEQTKELSIPSFPTSTGKLIGVEVSFTVVSEGTWAVENRTDRSGKSTVGGGTLSALRTHDGRELIAELQGDSRAASFEAFDGTLDFRGPSAAHGNWESAQTLVEKYTATEFWTDAAKPTLSLESAFSGRAALAPGFSSHLSARGEVRISVTYVYAPSSPPPAPKMAAPRGDVPALVGREHAVPLP